MWSHSVVWIFKKSRLLVLLCFARRCGAHMRHIGSPLVLLMCISRDHKLFELLRLTFFCVCMLVSRSWKHLQVLGTKSIAGGWLSAVVMR